MGIDEVAWEHQLGNKTTEHSIADINSGQVDAFDETAFGITHPSLQLYPSSWAAAYM